MSSNIDLREFYNNTEVKDSLGQFLSGKKGYKVTDEPRIIHCPGCKIKLKDNLKFCPECGTKLEPEKPKNCSNCNTILKIGQKFCTECGTKTP